MVKNYINIQIEITVNNDNNPIITTFKFKDLFCSWVKVLVLNSSLWAENDKNIYKGRTFCVKLLHCATQTGGLLSLYVNYLHTCAS